jgi:nucleotide-binding universal stress UspA family protein
MAAEIVVGYDGTEVADVALDVAIGLARDTSAKLIVVFGYDPARIGGEVRDLDQALEKRGEEAIRKAREKADAEGVETEPAIVKSKPSTALSEIAVQRGARFIVVGGYSERPVAGAILGSTPHKLLHISEVPVIVVPIGE